MKRKPAKITPIRSEQRDQTAPTPATPPAGVPLLVTFAEAADRLGGVSRWYVSKLVREGKIKAVGQNHARRVVFQSILDYIRREAYGDE
jgi:hypothetical protein